MKVKTPARHGGFDVEAARLGIDPRDLSEVISSKQLRKWISRNKLRRYIPLTVLSATKTVVEEDNFL
jgi:hypothetical protein